MFTHPLELIPVIVYVVLDVGFAVVVVHTEQLKAVLSDQVYVLAPLAVKVVLEPVHMAGDEGVTVIVGNGFTVTVKFLLPTQPVVAVPLTL